MDTFQLMLLYRQVLKEETAERKEKFDTINQLNKIWVKNFSELLKGIQIFTNPEMYSELQKLEKLEVLKTDVSEKTFPDLWKEMMKVIPQEYIVEDEKPDISTILPEPDDKISELITGWVSQSQSRKREEGEQ